MEGKTGPDPGTQAIVQQHVDALLSASPALGTFPDDRRQAIVQATAKVAQFVVGGRASPAMPGTGHAGLAPSVDFPEFVRGLIDGVFRSVVDSSVEQMQAYGDLVQSVADRIDAGERREAVAGAILAGINRISTTGGGQRARRGFRPSEP